MLYLFSTIENIVHEKGKAEAWPMAINGLVMDNGLDIQLEGAVKAYMASGVEKLVNYQKFYLYSIVTHSTAIWGSYRH